MQNQGEQYKDEIEQQIKYDAVCEVARQAILECSGFVCAHDTDINDETLNYVGSCDECPVIDAEGFHPLANESICRRERFFNNK